MSNKVQLIKQEIERIEQILDDFNKTHNNTIDNGIVSAKKNICKHIKSFIASLPEEPASEDLEEKITKCYKSQNGLMMTRKQFGEIIHRFTEWQKQKDLEALQIEYEKGLFDMREAMMKDAVEGRVQCGYGDGNKLSIKAMLPQDSDLKYADKVKVLILKTE